MQRPASGDGTELVEQWIAEIVAHPIEESEVSEIRTFRGNDGNPALALQLNEEGVPLWWPRRRPKTREVLSETQRRALFLEWLCGVWNVRDKKIRLGSTAYRRRRLGIELVCLQSEITEAWDQMPWES